MHIFAFYVLLLGDLLTKYGSLLLSDQLKTDATHNRLRLRRSLGALCTLQMTKTLDDNAGYAKSVLTSRRRGGMKA